MSPEEFINNGGRIFHRHEGKRTVSVAYKFNEEDKTSVTYGATIHRSESSSDQWERDKHAKMAVFRCNTCGVTLENETDNAHALRNFIRKTMFEKGCYEI